MTSAQSSSHTIDDAEASAGVPLSEVVAALSYALDITEGQPEGHAVRSAMIGMRLAAEIGLPDADRSSLFYALLLKDLGCSSNAAKVCSLLAADDRAAKHALKTVDWTKLGASAAYVARHAAKRSGTVARAVKVARIALQGPSASKPLFEIRCERGASIARLTGFSDATAEAIRCLDEHWDGRGYPRGLRGEAIPLFGRILGIAQTAEVFFRGYGVEAMYEMARRRRGRWFDPELIDALESIRADKAFWEELAGEDVAARLVELEPQDAPIVADEERVDRIALGFAKVIDAKSPWTYRHSEGVAEIAVGVASVLGWERDELRTLRRAGLLHDIGKLGVSNLILDKPGKLTEDEWRELRMHPAYTKQILDRVACFRGFSDAASAHHERLDGKGYHRGLAAGELAPMTKILTVADILEALSAKRPYRPEQPVEKAFAIMSQDLGTGICPECFEALREFVDTASWRPGERDSNDVETVDELSAVVA